MKRRLVLIFPKLLPVHLGKDVGKVPLCLERFGGFQAEIWGGEAAELKDIQFHDIELHPLRSSQGFSMFLEVFWQLVRSRSQIDCLMLFHFKIETLIFCLLFRLLSPHGVIYLKSDANFSVDALLRSPLKRIAVWSIMRLSHCVSFETSQVFQLFRTEFPQFVEKFVLLPNEIDPDELPQEEIRKENVMVTAGRLGLKTKGTLKLLHMLQRIEDELAGWKVLFVGDFSEIELNVREFFDTYPSMSQLVEFTGHISSRKELFEIYQKSRVYLVPSTTESFGIAMLEAAFCGNVLVGYDVGGMKDMTDGARFGKVLPVHDEASFVEAVRGYLSDQEALVREGVGIQKYVHEKFVWGKNIPQIVQRLTA